MRRPPGRTSLSVLAAALLTAAGFAGGTAGATVLTILNDDDPGEGFNDPTPVDPAPGNPGATLGEQRLNVFQAAADAWGAIVDSAVEIPIIAGMDPLPCDESSGVLGGAGNTVFIASSELPRADTWYPFALVNALEGVDVGPFVGLPPGTPNIGATFNSDVDTDPDCLTGITWWYGIGTPPPAGTIDFFTTVLHEIAHGLGFATPVDRETGERLGDMDDIYMVFLEDHSTGETWPEMSDGERAVSAIDTGDLHWIGANAVGRAGEVLAAGVHASGHVRMYAPDPLELGSSVSHWDTVVSPDELMEPFLTEGARDRITTDLLVDLGWPLSEGLSAVAGLIVPGFAVEVGDPAGPTTFFGVRNTTDGDVTVNVDYYGEELAGGPLRTDVFDVGPHQTLPWNVRSDLTGLAVGEGFATGLIVITEEGGTTAPHLEGDYFRLDPGNDFAAGDRLVRAADFCLQQEIRFVDFGSGSQLRVLLDRPRGVDAASFTYTAYDEPGAMIEQGEFFTSAHLNVIDIGDLVTGENFGTVLFDFTNSAGGFATAEYSAFGRFSLELNAACRSQ